MRSLLFTLSLSFALTACAGGVSGSFRGNNGGQQIGPPVAAADVRVAASKAAMSGSYTEIGIAKGRAPTAQQAVDQAKFHCGKNGGNWLIMNTEPFQSGSSYQVDAACAKQ